MNLSGEPKRDGNPERSGLPIAANTALRNERGLRHLPALSATPDESTAYLTPTGVAKSKDCCQFRSAMFLATPLDLPADRPCAVQRLDEGQRGGPATNQEAGGPALLADRHVRTAYVRQVRLISDVQLFTRRGNDWTNHFRKSQPTHGISARLRNHRRRDRGARGRGHNRTRLRK